MDNEKIKIKIKKKPFKFCVILPFPIPSVILEPVLDSAIHPVETTSNKTEPGGSARVI